MQRASGKGTMKDANRRAQKGSWQNKGSYNMGGKDQDIRCGSCEKKLNRARFSNNAIKKYETAVNNAKGRNKGTGNIILPNCRECTGGGREEMFCQGCQKTYSLDMFFKAQRQKSDNAVCMSCAQEAEDKVADVKDAIHEQELIDKLESHTGSTVAYNMTSLRDNLSSVGKGYGASGAASNTGRTTSNADSGAVWIQPDRSQTGRGLNSSNGAGARGAASDSDSDGAPSTVKNGRSAIGSRSSGGWADSGAIEQTFRPSRPNGSSASYATGGTNRGFATTKAYKDDAATRARAALERENNKRMLAEQDDEDDEDGQSDNSDDEPPY